MICHHYSIELLDDGYYCKNKFCNEKLSVYAIQPKSESFAGANWRCDEECACPRNEAKDVSGGAGGDGSFGNYDELLIKKFWDEYEKRQNNAPEALGDEEDEETTQESIKKLNARIDDLEKILSDLHSILDKHFRPF